MRRFILQNRNRDKLEKKEKSRSKIDDVKKKEKEQVSNYKNVQNPISHSTMNTCNVEAFF